MIDSVGPLPTFRYNASMNTIKRTVPIAQLVLILPAALFMISLIVRGLGPVQYEPTHAAQQIVMWYSGRIWTLWVLLTALPLAVFGIGCAMLFSQWATQPRALPTAMRWNGTALLVAALTLASAVILVIVGVHVLMN